MEKQNENPLHELDQLKQQYESFRQNLEGKKIIDEETIAHTVKHCRNFFKSHAVSVLIDYPIAIAALLGNLALYHVAPFFFFTTTTLMLLGMFTELWIVKDLTRFCQRDSLAKFSQRLFEAKRILLIYYLSLACSLLFITFVVAIVAEFPSLILLLLVTVVVEIGYLLLFHYVSLLNQCNKALGTLPTDNEANKHSGRWLKFFGFVILFFAGLTALLKLFALPVGTLVMLFTALLVLVFSIALVVWLHRSRSFPILLGLLMVVAILAMTYLIMARVNCWPPMGHF